LGNPQASRSGEHNLVVDCGDFTVSVMWVAYISIENRPAVSRNNEFVVRLLKDNEVPELTWANAEYATTAK
jgi:hypothetical protein